MKQGIHNLRSQQYQLLFVDNGILHGPELEDWKVLKATETYWSVTISDQRVLLALRKQNFCLRLKVLLVSEVYCQRAQHPSSLCAYAWMFCQLFWLFWCWCVFLVQLFCMTNVQCVARFTSKIFLYVLFTQWVECSDSLWMMMSVYFAHVQRSIQRLFMAGKTSWPLVSDMLTWCAGRIQLVAPQQSKHKFSLPCSSALGILLLARSIHYWQSISPLHRPSANSIEHLAPALHCYNCKFALIVKSIWSFNLSDLQLTDDQHRMYTRSNRSSKAHLASCTTNICWKMVIVATAP